MITPHTVSLVDGRPGADGTMAWTLTLLRGVMLQSAESPGVNTEGFRGAAGTSLRVLAARAESTMLYIPFSVQAEDAAGETKQYLPPKAYAALTDRSGFWTLDPAGEEAARCAYFTDEVLAAPLPLQTARETLGHVWTVGGVRSCNYGSAALQHWEVTGV